MDRSNVPSPERAAPPIWLSLLRGLTKRCPRCGKGALFTSWYTMADRCSTCDLEYQPLEGDTWAFMYLSTAFLTGLIIVGMLLVAPSVLWLGRVVVTVIAVFLIGFSLPHRKGLAVALDFVVSEKVEPRGGD